MTERPVGSGTWRLRVYVGRDPVTDNPVQVQRTFHGTKTAARRALAALVADVEKGKFDRTKVTVGELLDAWLAHIEAIGKARPKTLYEYQRKINGRIRPALGKLRLTQLEPDTLDIWYKRWLSEGLSPSTVRIYHSILSSACRQAVKWGWLDQAPTGRASPPSPKPPTMKVPTPHQLSLIIDSAKVSDPVLEVAITLAALTGARRGELVALRWSDVDFDRNMLRIERAVTVVAGVVLEGATKTHQVRQVALDSVALDMLRRHRQFVEERSVLADSPLVHDPFVLSYQAHSGTPVGPDTLTHRFRATCLRTQARVELAAKQAGRMAKPDEPWNFHFHELRHFSVTTLLAAGMDVRTVAERHGHAQATMTLNRYAHALPERDRSAADILGEALKQVR